MLALVAAAAAARPAPPRLAALDADFRPDARSAALAALDADLARLDHLNRQGA